MPQGTHSHNTPAYTARSISTNSPTTLNSPYAGSYSAADLSTYPSGGVKNTSTIEDLRKNLNQLGKDFNDAIVSHQNQITKNDGDIAAIDTNLTEHATDLSAIATDLRNKAWDTITIVPGTGLSASEGTSDTADDITNCPNGKNLQSDIQLDLDVATDTEIGGLLSNDNQTLTALGASNDGQPVKGHLDIDASGNTFIKNHALELGVKTHGKYVKTLTPITGDGINVLNGDVNNGGDATIGLVTLIGAPGSTFILPNSSTATGGDNGTGGILNVPVPRINANEFGQLLNSPSTMDVKSANNYDITVEAANSILSVTNGTVKQNKGENQTITINHGSVNVQADQTFTSVVPAGNNDTPHREVEILGSIEFDAYGHVDGIAKRNLTYGLNSPLSVDYGGSATFDMQIPRESDFESLRTTVDNLQGDTISLGPPSNVVTVDREFNFTKDVTLGEDSQFNVGNGKLFVTDDSPAIAQVGIGTQTPTAGKVLDVVGDGKFSGTLEVGGDLTIPRKITHEGDTNTYIDFEAADNIRIKSGGNDAIFIDSDGDVGIGTTSPGTKLDVSGTIRSKGTGPIFMLTDTSSSPAGGDSTTTGYNQTAIAIGNNHTFEIQTRDGDGDFVSNDYRITKNSNGAGEHQFRIADTEKFTIENTLVQAETNLKTTGDLTADGNVYLGNANTDIVSISGDLTVGNSALKVDVSNGRIGFGQSTPAYPLDITNAGLYIDHHVIGAQGLAANRKLLLLSDTTNGGGANIELYSGTHSVSAQQNNIYIDAKQHRFRNVAANDTILYIDTDEDFVGINTTNNSSDTIEIGGNNETFGPYEFHVAGDSKLGGDVNITGKLAVAGISSLSGSVDYDNVSLTEINAITMEGILDVNDNTSSTNTTTGAVQVTGGVGIVENLNVGGTLKATGATTLSSTLQVDGNATIGNSVSTDEHTIKGKTFVEGRLVVGSSPTSDANIISFRGTAGDGSVNHTAIAERIYDSPSEASELILFKGNDSSTTHGPDRIRHRAAEHVFQTIDSGSETNTDRQFQTTTAIPDTNTRLIVKNSGNVGIGTDSPGARLHVKGSVATPLKLERTSSNANVNIAFADDANTWYAGLAADNGFGIGNNADLNSAGKLVIRSNGNVGIGSQSPSEKLEVVGKIKVNSNATVFNNGPTNAPLYIQKDDSPMAIGIDANEIETSQGLSIRVASGQSLTFSNVNTASNISAGESYSVTNMQISPAGKVGIGISDPAEKLHVVGALRLDGEQGQFDNFHENDDQLVRKEYIQFPKTDSDSPAGSSNDGARIYAEKRSRPTTSSSNAGSLILEINDDFGVDGDGFGIRNTGADEFRNTAYFCSNTVNLLSLNTNTKSSADSPQGTGFEDSSEYAYQFHPNVATFHPTTSDGETFDASETSVGCGMGNTNRGISIKRQSDGAFISISRSAGTPLTLNRNNNGDMIHFRRSGSINCIMGSQDASGYRFYVSTGSSDSPTNKRRIAINEEGRTLIESGAVVFGNRIHRKGTPSNFDALEIRRPTTGDSPNATETGDHLSFRTSDGTQQHAITATSNGLIIKTESSASAERNIKIQPIGGTTTATFASSITTLVGDLKVDDTTFNVDASDNQVRIGRAASISGAEGAKLIIQSQASGMADTIVLANTESGATGNTIRALRGLTLASDQESNSNTSDQSVVRITTDDKEVMRCESVDNNADHVKTTFTGLVRNNGITTINTGSSGTFNVDLRDNNIFQINVEGNTTMNLQNISVTAGATYTFIILNGGAFDINFDDDMLFAGGDPIISSGNGKKDLVSGISDGSKLYCALTLNLTAAS